MLFKKKEQTQQNKASKWVFGALLLFIIVIAILVYIGYLSNKRSKDAIEDKLLGETSAYAARVGSAIETVAYEATGASAIIGSNGIVSEEDMLAYAQALVDNSTSVYLAVITDCNGAGYASTGSLVDLSNKEYYNTGLTTNYAYINDDGILGKKAFVVSVPYAVDGMAAGYVYLYEEANSVFRHLPSKSYGNSLAFAIIDTEGRIISATGAESHFNSGDSLFTNLKGTEVSGLTLSQIKVKVEKNAKAYFFARGGGESRAIVIAPTSANDWELAIIINESYTNAVIKSNMSGIVRMIIITIVVFCVFTVFIIIIFLVDKFRQKEENKGLEDKADTDLLTGVNNKIATERKIQEYMTENPDTQSLMFLFDIDNFKKINDTMGHSFGDEVLRTLGHQLTNEFRSTDIIGRLGGDEFVVFLKNIKNDDQLEREGQRITALFHQFKAGDYVKYSATASIGAVVFPRDGGDFVTAYKLADKALYEAKRRGKNQLVFYNSNLAEVESIRAEDPE